MLKNKKLMSIVTIIFASMLLIGIISAIILLKPKDNKTIDSSYFVIGKINDDGEFMKSNDYICTKELIACDGLVISPKYTTSSKYQLFFYDKDYKFINKTNVLEDKYYFLDSFPFVEYCRIMILPDRNGKSADDFSVSIFNKSNYVKEFNISVDVNQVFEKYKDYFEEDSSTRNKKLTAEWGSMTYSFKDFDGIGCSKVIDLTNVNSIYFVTTEPLKGSDSYFQYFWLNEAGKVASYTYTAQYTSMNGFYIAKLDSSEYSSIIFSYYLDSEFHVYLDKG